MKREMMGIIVKRDDGSEIVNYDDPSFPSYIYAGWIAPKVTWERVPHFHEDIEIVTVTSGTMAYSVNGKVIVLNEGDTIFVNSNQIHFSMCINDSVARYVIFVFHPNIISTSAAVEMNYVLPLITNPNIPYIRFRYINEEVENIRNLVLSLPDVRTDAFKVTKTLFSIWEILLKRSRLLEISEESEDHSDTNRRAFKSMLFFIQQEYKRTITLDDIASSANISKSLCNRLFNQYVKESPISYVMHFRAQKAAEYLRFGTDPISKIASMTGFGGASYMSETFKKYYGMSPVRYRKKWADPESMGPGQIRDNEG